MAFKRQVLGPGFERESLTEAMVGIGMLFAGSAKRGLPPIEDILLAASSEGMDHHDLRVLSVLTTWLDLHSPRVNVDRLVRALSGTASARVRVYWAAVAAWKHADLRWGRVRKLYSGPREDITPQGTAFLVKRHGEDPRFLAGPMRVPLGTLRDRREDVLSPERLAKQHRGYFWRVVIGSTYRADMWARLEVEPNISAAELARKSYGSFATAWQVRRDWAVAHKAKRAK